MARRPDIDKSASEVRKILESVGDSSMLDTEDKETLVKAINEVKRESKGASEDVINKADKAEFEAHARNNDIHVTPDFQIAISDSYIQNL